MESVFDRNRFVGPAIDVSRFGGTFAGSSTFTGAVVLTTWRRFEVQSLLPAELEPASTSDGLQLHPVVFIFGRLEDGAWIFGGFTLPVGIEYWEFCCAIPFVKHRDGQYLHTFVPRMYSSSFAAVWDGNARYGLAKKLARMRWHDSVFVLVDERQSLLLHAAVEPKGSRTRGDVCRVPNFEALREMFRLPILGRKDDGKFVTSYFDWGLDEADVSGADSYLSIDAPLFDGVSPRRFHDIRSRSFLLYGMNWKLSWPKSSRL
jgi:hypothetical protein